MWKKELRFDLLFGETEPGKIYSPLEYSAEPIKLICIHSEACDCDLALHDITHLPGLLFIGHAHRVHGSSDHSFEYLGLPERTALSFFFGAIQITQIKHPAGMAP